MNIKLINNSEINNALNIFNNAFNKNIKTITSLNNVYGYYINDKLIGIVQIDYIFNTFSNEKEAIINNFCIDISEQNKGYGKQFLNQIINLIKENNANIIILTSKKEKIKANKLYLDLGFKIKETNVFIKTI